MQQRERERLKLRYGSPGVEIKTARDGLSVYVNLSNPIQELTLQQIRDIYTRRIVNWKDVGGYDNPITLFGRENNSGTFVYFKDMVLSGEEYAVSMRELPGTAAIVAAVAADSLGIGYGGVAYGKGVREIRVKKDASSISYAPTPANIRSGVYPICRFLYVYVRDNPKGELKKFIDWILGGEGQRIAEEVGYFALQ